MDSHENGFVDLPVEDKSTNIMCMLDVIPYNHELPKYDQYDDYYVFEIEADSSRKSRACFWEEKCQLK